MRVELTHMFNESGTVFLGCLVVFLLLPALGQLWNNRDVLASAQWILVAVGLLTSMATYLAAAVALRAASGIRLPFSTTVEAQLAGSFTNKFTPAGLGGMSVGIRYLQRSGVALAAATAAVGLTFAAGAVVQTSAIVLTGGRADLSQVLPFHLTPLALGVIGLAAAAVVAAVLTFVPPARDAVLRPVRQAGDKLAELVHEPLRATRLLAGQIGVTTLYLSTFLLASRAFGIDQPLPLLAFVYFTASAIGSAVPTPGGLGAVEAALTAALTSIGVDPAAAVAAVLTFRVLTYWLPMPIGALALTRLRRRGCL